jgi:hypothetical protein
VVCVANQLKALRQDDVRRAAAVAADYNQLQGLTTATTGAGLVVWAFGPGLLWGPFIIAAGVSITVAWYEKRYGKVRQRGALATSVGLVLLALVVLMVALMADRLLWPTDSTFPPGSETMGASPVLLLPLVGAACLAVSYRVGYRHVGVTWVHWTVVGLLVVSALAPALGLALLGPGSGLVVLGVALVAIGIVDHVRLVQAMKPVPHD